MMTLHEFYATAGGEKRYLVTEAIACGRTLEQVYEKTSRAVKKDVTYITSGDLAQQITAWVWASAEKDIKMMTPQDNAALIACLIRDNQDKLVYFKNPNVINTATATEISRCVDFLRTYDVKKITPQTAKCRIYCC